MSVGSAIPVPTSPPVSAPSLHNSAHRTACSGAHLRWRWQRRNPTRPAAWAALEVAPQTPDRPGQPVRSDPRVLCTHQGKFESINPWRRTLKQQSFCEQDLQCRIPISSESGPALTNSVHTAKSAGSASHVPGVQLLIPSSSECDCTAFSTSRDSRTASVGPRASSASFPQQTSPPTIGHQACRSGPSGHPYLQ